MRFRAFTRKSAGLTMALAAWSFCGSFCVQAKQPNAREQRSYLSKKKSRGSVSVMGRKVIDEPNADVVAGRVRTMRSADDQSAVQGNPWVKRDKNGLLVAVDVSAPPPPSERVYKVVSPPHERGNDAESTETMRRIFEGGVGAPSSGSGEW